MLLILSFLFFFLVVDDSGTSDSSGFEHWFINSSTTSNESKHSSVSAGVELFDTGWKFYSGFAGVGVVGNNGAVTTGSFSDLASITRFFFQLADDGTFWHLSDWHDVTNVEGSFFTGMDELSGTNTFWANHGFGDFSVLVWVFKLDFGERSTPAWVVNDVFYKTLDKTLSLGIIERSEFSSAFSAFASTGENGTSTFPLALNHSSHTNVSSVSST